MPSRTADRVRREQRRALGRRSPGGWCPTHWLKKLGDRQPGLRVGQHLAGLGRHVGLAWPSSPLPAASSRASSGPDAQIRNDSRVASSYGAERHQLRARVGRRRASPGGTGSSATAARRGSSPRCPRRSCRRRGPPCTRPSSVLLVRWRSSGGGRRAARRRLGEVQRAGVSRRARRCRSVVSAGRFCDGCLGQRLGDQHVLLGVQRRHGQDAGVVVEPVGDLVGGQVRRPAPDRRSAGSCTVFAYSNRVRRRSGVGVITVVGQAARSPSSPAAPPPAPTPVLPAVPAPLDVPPPPVVAPLPALPGPPPPAPPTTPVQPAARARTRTWVWKAGLGRIRPPSLRSSSGCAMKLTLITGFNSGLPQMSSPSAATRTSHHRPTVRPRGKFRSCGGPVGRTEREESSARRASGATGLTRW